MTAPTWRHLAARARKLGLRIDHGRHEAALLGYGADCRFVSWTSDNAADGRVLRAAVAAALAELENQ